MMKRFHSAMARATRRAGVESVRATSAVMAELFEAMVETPPKQRAPRVAKAPVPAAPRVAPLAPVRPRRASFRALSFTGDQGQRDYKLYAPPGASPDAALPLIVMLHGCMQTPDDFAAGTRMNQLAAELGFFVAYPAQPRGEHANRCWNWFRPEDQARDLGEPALIAGITRRILRDQPVDPARVYIAGLSAGGAMAATVAALYPELFAALGVHSGLPACAARNAGQAVLAMTHGAYGEPRALPQPTIVFHGDRDTVVNPRNGRSVIARAVGAYPALRRTEKRGRSAGGQEFVRTTHRGAGSKSFCEHWVVIGAGHGWSGGSRAGSFTEPAGPDASREMARFFLRHRVPARRRGPAGGVPG